MLPDMCCMLDVMIEVIDKRIQKYGKYRVSHFNLFKEIIPQIKRRGHFKSIQKI